MHKKATEKLRRVIDAYEFLQTHPHAEEAARHEPRHSAPPPRRPAARPTDQRHEVARALAELQQRAIALNQRVAELDRRALAEWEPSAWAAIGAGVVLPFAGVFLLPREFMLALGSLPWLVCGGSSVALLVLAFYRFGRIGEEMEEAIRAVGSADVTCGRCGRGVVGTISLASYERALAHADWALTHLQCRHCRRSLV
jgi:hypothetical protein